uniref:ELAV like RNA binding protein 1 n=1 Tax=Molossus molossus TaxID=27622 RepID=A0A7J8I6B3_MOLMO|nr:ELAV like RNA binding protein 1 [Molossus molossus]
MNAYATPKGIATHRLRTTGLRESPGQSKLCEPGCWSPRYGALMPTPWGKGSRNEQRPQPTRLSRRKLPLGSSPYVSGAFQAASSTLEPGGSDSK